ncbi:MAG: transglycosylase domain-containing protein, partial [Lachnospiraceae bacterium]|nr:transglycosylase domain-containing protein [Lachnospiraceae bacterium]
PDISNIDVTPRGFSTFVYDAEGNQTAKLVSTDSNRIPVSMDMIPDDLKHAFVAIEDQRFYEHNGIDIQGIMRAAYVGISSGKFSEGASTITQQLLKNNVFTNWTQEDAFIDKVKRKVQEQYLAVQLEKTMSKEDILLNYMNTVNLGQNTLGVQAASLRYFNKSVSNLTLSECAVIACITQNPSWWNPISHPENNMERREKVLRDMKAQGYITDEAYDEAMADDPYSRIQETNVDVGEQSINSYFVDALTKEVLQDLMAAGYNETQAYTLLYSGGLKIYSTQDPAIQAICDEVFQNPENFPADTKWEMEYALTVEHADGSTTNHSTQMLIAHFEQQRSGFKVTYTSQENGLADVEAYKAAVMEEGDTIQAEKVTFVPQPQVSLVIEDQSTGYVVAMEGGRGAKEANRTFNRATDAVRQPGSTFKIVSTYAPALDAAGKTLASVIEDAPFNYDDGRPVRNWWGQEYRGLSSIRDGIRDSMNVVTVKLLTEITPQLGYDYLKNFGFTTVIDGEEIGGKVYSDITQSTALGGLTYGVKNIELNAAYAAIANHGTYIKPKLYTKIVDHDGNVIIDNTQPQARQVLKETTAFLLTSAMTDVVTSGTGTAVNFGGTAIAGKTGTTSDNNDVWFSGYTKYYTATTWAGYDNATNKPSNATKLGTSAERNLAKSLWRATMSKIHADLPAANFDVPQGIVTATVCAQSGMIPIQGLCGATLKVEYFAEGSVPTESCAVHFKGSVCAYTGQPACETCPFKIDGVATISPENGGTLSRCPHDEVFFAQPNAAEVIEQQRLELVERTNAAIAAAQAQAQEQGVDYVDGNDAEAAAQAAQAAAAAAAAQAQAEAAAGQGTGQSDTDVDIVDPIQ